LLIGQQNEYDALQFSEAVSSLIHYAYVHFATEERYLAQANYPDIKAHILEPCWFHYETLELSLKVHEGTQDNRLDLLRYLEKWYSLHVLGIDRQYIPYLAANGIK